MKLEKITENQTRNTYEITLIIVGDNGTIYGNIYGLFIQNHLGSYSSRVKFFMRGRLLTDTQDQEGTKLGDLISRVLRENSIELDDERQRI